jgi:predicted lactoylglutathione lyase
MATQSRKLFLNLAVSDLKRSMEFFRKLGFEFNPQFSNEQGACMIVSEEAFVMLLSEPFFKTFTKKPLCDTTKQTEAISAFSCASRAEVDQIAEKALAAGAQQAMDPQEHGFMYGRSFYDLDGHHWELVWMDPKGLQ